jgi:hypothetical protein
LISVPTVNSSLVEYDPAFFQFIPLFLKNSTQINLFPEPFCSADNTLPPKGVVSAAGTFYLLIRFVPPNFLSHFHNARTTPM